MGSREEKSDILTIRNCAIKLYTQKKQGFVFFYKLATIFFISIKSHPLSLDMFTESEMHDIMHKKTKSHRCMCTVNPGS